MSTTYNYYHVTLKQIAACIPNAIVEHIHDYNDGKEPCYRITWISALDGVQNGVEVWITSTGQIRVDAAIDIARNGQKEFIDLLNKHNISYTHID